MVDYQSLRAALVVGGLIPGDIVAGSLQRCKVEGDRDGKKSGAYLLFDDDCPACPWWNWRAGTSGVWVSTGRPLTDADRTRHQLRIERARRERQEEQTARWARNREYLTQLWAGAKPVTEESAAGLYLIRRELIVPDTSALRYAPSLDYWDDGGQVGTFPALLAAVTAPDGTLLAIHRTYLTRGGRKAPVPTVKKLTRTGGCARPGLVWWPVSCCRTRLEIGMMNWCHGGRRYE